MLELATLFSSYCLIHPSFSPISHYLNIQVFLYPRNLQGFQDLRNNRDLHDYNDLYDLLVLRGPHHHLQSLKSFKSVKITFTRLYDIRDATDKVTFAKFSFVFSNLTSFFSSFCISFFSWLLATSLPASLFAHCPYFVWSFHHKHLPSTRVSVQFHTDEKRIFAQVKKCS